MNIITHIHTANDCYKDGRYIKPTGLMLHSVGCAQPSAAVFDGLFNAPNLGKEVHAFIDATSDKVIQVLPWNKRGWHAGGAANNTHIGVEMCESDAIKYTTGANFKVIDAVRAKAQCTQAYQNAVELFAKLCKDYGISPASIISHHEGYLRGVACNHADPEHYWNQLGIGYTMDGFRKDVSVKMGNITPDPKPSNVPYIVRITVSSLNIRKGPGTNTATYNKFIAPGAYTIVRESTGPGSTNGWGLLKAYEAGQNGWIALDYAEKIGYPEQ